MKPVEELVYLTKHYRQLQGLVVTGFEIERDEEFDEIWPTLVLSSEDGKRTVKVTVSQDPEGNGPGYLFVEEVKS